MAFRHATLRHVPIPYAAVFHATVPLFPHHHGATIATSGLNTCPRPTSDTSLLLPPPRLPPTYLKHVIQRRIREKAKLQLAFRGVHYNFHAWGRPRSLFLPRHVSLHSPTWSPYRFASRPLNPVLAALHVLLLIPFHPLSIARRVQLRQQHASYRP